MLNWILFNMGIFLIISGVTYVLVKDEEFVATMIAIIGGLFIVWTFIAPCVNSLLYDEVIEDSEMLFELAEFENNNFYQIERKTMGEFYIVNESNRVKGEIKRTFAVLNTYIREEEDATARAEQIYQIKYRKTNWLDKIWGHTGDKVISLKTQTGEYVIVIPK